MKIVGNNTTIWAKKGSVIRIVSPGVTLENLRVELTEASITDTAVTAEKPATVNSVEVLGAVKGFGVEDGFFDIPRTVELGSFASGALNSFVVTVNVPVKTEVFCPGGEISVEPREINPGRNRLTFTVSGMTQGTILFAEVLFKSKFQRRIYVTGKSSDTAAAARDKEVYTAPERTSETISEPAADVISISETPDDSLPAISMTRGQRIPLTQYAGTDFSIYFSCEKPAGMDIDPYVFLLDEREQALSEKALVFFGNERSENGEVSYFHSDGHVEIDLTKADPRVRRIVLAYSVYAGDSRNCFSMVRNPQASLWTDRERISFTMDSLSGETTVVAMEFYLYKGEWKISAVGAGFKDGIAKLCNRCGIEVEQQ